MYSAFKHSKLLEEAGFSRHQAEIQVQVITEIIEGDLATKQDLKNLEHSTRQDLKNLEISTKQDLKNLENSTKQDLKSLENKIQQLEYRIIIKLGTLLIIGFTTMATLMKFWLA